MTRLLVLDFHGVCTLSAEELATAQRDPGDIGAAERPGAREIVAAARSAGVQVMVLSNEIDRTWVDRVPVLADVDEVVACADNGIFKPDRRAFQRCMLRAGAEPAETCVVDDGPDNVAVAQSLGATAVLFDVADHDPWGPVNAWLSQ